MLKHLYDCIAQLRPVDRMIVSLYLEENSHRQIATVMGISEGNVRVKLHRIKTELKQLCKEADYES